MFSNYHKRNENKVMKLSNLLVSGDEEAVLIQLKQDPNILKMTIKGEEKDIPAKYAEEVIRDAAVKNKSTSILSFLLYLKVKELLDSSNRMTDDEINKQINEMCILLEGGAQELDALDYLTKNRDDNVLLKWNELLISFVYPKSYSVEIVSSDVNLGEIPSDSKPRNRIIVALQDGEAMEGAKKICFSQILYTVKKLHGHFRTIEVGIKQGELLKQYYNEFKQAELDVNVKISYEAIKALLRITQDKGDTLPQHKLSKESLGKMLYLMGASLEKNGSRFVGIDYYGLAKQCNNQAAINRLEKSKLDQGSMDFKKNK